MTETTTTVDDNQKDEYRSQEETIQEADREYQSASSRIQNSHHVTNVDDVSSTTNQENDSTSTSPKASPTQPPPRAFQSLPFSPGTIMTQTSVPDDISMTSKSTATTSSILYERSKSLGYLEGEISNNNNNNNNNDAKNYRSSTRREEDILRRSTEAISAVQNLRLFLDNVDDFNTGGDKYINDTDKETVLSEAQVGESNINTIVTNDTTGESEANKSLLYSTTGDLESVEMAPPSDHNQDILANIQTTSSEVRNDSSSVPQESDTLNSNKKIISGILTPATFTHFNIASSSVIGTRSPSVLSSSRGSSSRGDSSSGATANVTVDTDERNTRSRRLSLTILLDQHHHRRRKKRNSATDFVWQDDSISLNTSSNDSYEETGLHTKRKDRKVNNNNKIVLKSDNEDTIKNVMKDAYPLDELSGSKRHAKRRDSMRSLPSIVSIDTTDVDKSNPKSIFHTFEKRWMAIHYPSQNDDKEMDTLDSEEFIQRRDHFKTERICFASLVIVLLDINEQIKLLTEGGNNMRLVSVPMEVMNLFLKEVILPESIFRSDKNSFLDQLVDNLFHKLRLLTFSSTKTNSNSVQLSHEVYGQYASYICHIDAIPSSQVESWHVKFVSLLEDVLSTESNPSNDFKCSNLQEYATRTLPNHILWPCVKDSSIDKSASVRKSVIKYLDLMKNANYLKWRMRILSKIGKSDEKKKRKSSKYSAVESMKDMPNMNVIKATKLHLLEIEQFLQTLGSKLFFSIGEEETDIVNDSIIKMYDAWRNNCYGELSMKIMKTIVANKRDSLTTVSLGKDYSTSNTNNGGGGEQEDDSSLVSEITFESNIFHPTSGEVNSRRSYMSNKNNRLVSYSIKSLSGLPKHLHPEIGEHKLNDDRVTSTLVEQYLQTDDLESKLNTKSSVRRRSIETIQNRRRTIDINKRKAACMKISDVLNIDIDLLYLEVAVGKALNLLSSSMAKSSNPAFLSKNSGFVVTGAASTTSQINYSADAISIYTRVMHVISFLLSEDLDDIDEEDLVGILSNKQTIGVDIKSDSLLKKLVVTRKKALNLLDRLKILSSETWFSLGSCLSHGLKADHSTSIENMVSTLSQLQSVIGNKAESDTKGTAESKTEQGSNIIPDVSIEDKILQCYQFSLLLLKQHTTSGKSSGSMTSLMSSKNSQNYSTSTEDISNGIDVYRRSLQASIIHSIGVHYFEQDGSCETAKLCLDESITRRRLLLRFLQKEEDDQSTNSRSTNSSKSNSSKKKSSDNNDPISSSSDLLIDTDSPLKSQIDALELGLSHTLEFYALCSHSLLEYKTSLSLFQEALILRALHVGKNSLEVASLQYNMGVVHDDLSQNEASLGRYTESLRLRLSHLDEVQTLYETIKAHKSCMLRTIVSSLEDLDSSIVLTLRCMGNVYRSMNDITNSIGCFLRAIQILKDCLKRRISGSSHGIYQSFDGDLGFGKAKKGLPQNLPMPLIILEEMQQTDDSATACSYFTSATGKTTLSPSMLGTDTTVDEMSSDDYVRKDIANLYSTLLSLVNDRKQSKSKSSKRLYTSGYASSSSSVSSYHSKKQSSKGGKNKEIDEHDDDDDILLDAAFNLGMITIHFGEFKNSLFFFEEALRTLWTSKPNSGSASSDESSDSDISSKKSSSSSVPHEKNSDSKKKKNECLVEEGILYHALAVCHSAMCDHERAVRCYITSLRYYRRRHGMQSYKVAGALYDCALSYWNLGDFTKASDFWTDCLKILLIQGIDIDDSDGNEGFSNQVTEAYVGKTLYNLAASKVCKTDYEDEYTATCVDDALSIFSQIQTSTGKDYSEVIGHCYFYLGLIFYHKAHNLMKYKKVIKSDVNDECKERSVYGFDRSNMTSIQDMLLYSLSCTEESQSLYLKNVASQKSNKEGLLHPMQSHISHMSGLIYAALGLEDKAFWSFTNSVRLLNIQYTEQNLYSASVMHSLGSLLVAKGDTDGAMKFYLDSLRIRQRLLGSMHPSVAESLHNLAGLHVSLNDYQTSFEMYSQALKIRSSYEANEGTGVAKTLLEMGILHAKFGFHSKSMECFEGALLRHKSQYQSLDYQQSNTKSSDEDSKDENNQKRNFEAEKRMVEIEIARILHNMGNVHVKCNDLKKALKSYTDSLNIRRKLVQLDIREMSESSKNEDIERNIFEDQYIYQDMADTLHNIGCVYEMTNTYEKALVCFNESLMIKRRLIPKKSSEDEELKKSIVDLVPIGDYAISCGTLSGSITLLRIGCIHVKLFNFDIALSYYKAALRIQRNHLGRDHIAVARTIAEMGEVFQRRVAFSRDNFYDYDSAYIRESEKYAMKCYQEAMRITKLHHGPNHVSTGKMLLLIGSIHDQKGDFNEALEYYNDSVRIFGKKYANTLCRSLFDTSFLQRRRDELTGYGDNELTNVVKLQDSYSRKGAANGVLVPPASSEWASSAYRALQKDKELYMKAYVSLSKVTSTTGSLKDSTLHGVSFFLLRLMEFIISKGIDPMSDSFRRSVHMVVEKLEKAGTHATITSQDRNSNQFLYLIQE